ncbi:hypothetical protein DEW08_19410 [Azospirillum thermophilum]|uniref:Flagellar biosynthesis protein n=2 Tax=Azospirillum thermophilum TaxID=2202148 RepID=A0A2S2CVF3_9PROT|nr:hypothetical protein DEW08_19410 [Azospirillum thermophilum]
MAGREGMAEAVPPPDPSSQAGVADSLVALARRRGIDVTDDLPIVALLEAIDPAPLVPHRMVLVAGAVMALAFRHDRSLAAAAADPGDGPTADRSF